MEWRNVYRGFIMGVSDLVPGVSGGTIAVLLGIYDRLIAGISGIFTKEWKVHFRFLFPLALGVATALFALSRVMRWLLAHHEAATKYFFIGLIIGILPFLFRESDAKNTFRWYHILLLIVSIVLIAQLPTNVEGTLIANRSLST